MEEYKKNIKKGEILGTSLSFQNILYIYNMYNIIAFPFKTYYSTFQNILYINKYCINKNSL